MYDTGLWLGGRELKSRLIVGTGKYPSFETMREALEASGADLVTVAVRRVSLPGQGESLLDHIDLTRYTLLPNTAGCFTADDAIRTLRLAREAGGWDLVKLEVLGEARTLYPDMRETLKATEVLTKEGFLPMVYCVDDPIAAKQLEEAGAVAVMPLGRRPVSSTPTMSGRRIHEARPSITLSASRPPTPIATTPSASTWGVWLSVPRSVRPGAPKVSRWTWWQMPLPGFE